MQLDFRKYQGLGNDFIVVEAETDTSLGPKQAQKWCDRRYGVGGDGLLVLTASAEGAARMIVLNADGSRPEMCGNGLRCVALHLATRRDAGSRFHVETDAGLLECQMSEREGSPWITISLGQATELKPLRLPVDGGELNFARISTGNPHAILFDSTHTAEDVDRIGPAVSAAIPGGANVEFVRQKGANELAVIVWAGGGGRTLACGTGAGAVAAAAALQGRASFDEPVKVWLPGGELEIVVSQADLDLQLGGPAQYVFSGQLDV